MQKDVSPLLHVNHLEAALVLFCHVCSGFKQKKKRKIEANFIINLHKKDVKLLKAIQDFFGGIGRISKERMVVVILQLVL